MSQTSKDFDGSWLILWIWDFWILVDWFMLVDLAWLIFVDLHWLLGVFCGFRDSG